MFPSSGLMDYEMIVVRVCTFSRFTNWPFSPIGLGISEVYVAHVWKIKEALPNGQV